MRAVLEQWLHNQWDHRGPLSWLVSPLSLIYLLLFRVKMARITPVTLPVPVVVVGNIYVGGTGKTPITIELVRALTRAGFTPGVISRGYGRSSDSAQLVTSDSPVQIVGDEPLLIAQTAQCPTAVGRRRIEAAKLLLAKHPEVNVIISDDGLQHKELARDVELAVIGARGLGNGWVLPAGPLREPPSRLDTVDAIILNATTDVVTSRTPRFAATSELAHATQLSTGKTLDIDDLSHRLKEKEARVLACAGIAAPSRFFSMLRAHDISCDTLALGDHYDYRDNPFTQSDCDTILVTMKDAVKIRQNPTLYSDPRIWVVELETVLDPYCVELVIQKTQLALKALSLPEVNPSLDVTH